MMSKAKVRRVESLRELNAKLCSFSQSLADELRSIQHEINKTIEWIAKRERHWRDEVRKWTVALDQARQSLRACQLQTDADGHPVDCSREAAAVRRTEAELATARKELDNAVRWRGKVDSQVSFYLSKASQARELANVTLGQGSSFLRAKAAELDAYAAASMPSPTQIASFGNHGSDFNRAKQQMLLRALDDPLVSRQIKGWVRHELRRMAHLQRAVAEGRDVEHPHRNYIRMPYGFDAGHRIPGVDTPANLRFEDIWVNRSRWHRARRLGVEDRLR